MKRGTRVPINVSQQDLCVFEPLGSTGRLPIVVRPRVAGVQLDAWLSQQRLAVAAHLRQHGGVLFRGFAVTAPEQFEQCIAAVSGELLEYTYRSTPRRRVAGQIYTSTEYPADRSIPLHNEMSYTHTWPLKIWFCCVQPAQREGETPIADSRRVYQRLPPSLRDQFTRRQVMYVRNYGEGVDLPWQEVFQTTDKGEVERLCREAAIDVEWRGDERLTTRQVCRAVATHPETGEDVWFNQAHLFHSTSLDPESRELLLQRFAEDELPRNACYGDGGPIEHSALEDIRAVYAEEAVVFPWQAGDVLLLDNMLTAHGRRPFQGPRQVLTGMAERQGTALTI